MTREDLNAICMFTPVSHQLMCSEPIWKAVDTYVGVLLTGGRCSGCYACAPLETPYPREKLPFGLYLWEYLTKLGF
jgi:hypothetical protein